MKSILEKAYLTYKKIQLFHNIIRDSNFLHSTPTLTDFTLISLMLNNKKNSHRFASIFTINFIYN